MALVMGVGEDIVTKEQNETMLCIFNEWSLGMFDPDFSNIDKPGTLLGDGMIARYFEIGFLWNFPLILSILTHSI